jgi:anthranilate 1,2-dioxygenase large subunit
MSPSVQGPHWPKADFSRVPYEVFTDPEFYRIEMKRIFRGPVWHYLALDIELPSYGDFRTTWLGDANVVVARAKDGSVHAFENTCAHRGARIVDELHGNVKRFVCPYHLWTYSIDGRLTGVPLERGIMGKGGMPACFDKGEHGLRTLKVTSYGGLIFGTYAEQIEPIEEYLGHAACRQIDRLLVQRKPKLLGYLRQRIPANWKLYDENVRDPYHASLLHLFQASFGIQQPTMRGGVHFDKDAKNVWNHSILGKDDKENAAALETAYAGTGKYVPDLKMADPSLIHVPLDLPDGIKTTILSIFPTLIVAQVDNTYAVRHLRPKGPSLVELHLTYLGFESDDEKHLQDKLTCSNLVGPAGYISMEDGEALRLVQEGVKSAGGRHSIIAMGGTGEIKDTDYISHEISIRGFWRHYHKLMQLSPPGE